MNSIKFNNLLLRSPMNPISRFLYFHKIHDLFNCIGNNQCYSFVDSLLSKLNITYDFINIHGSRNIPKNGSCIIIANHPTGLLDGVILIKMISTVRKDIKIVVNIKLRDILNLNNIFSDQFIYINPLKSSNEQKSNYTGIKQVHDALKEGKLVIFFPSGDISKINIPKLSIIDYNWDPVCIKMLYRSNVIVLPIYIKSRNSLLFYLLNTINNKIGLLMLVRETFIKSNTIIYLSIGDTFSPQKLNLNHNQFELAIKKRVYDLKRLT